MKKEIVLLGDSIMAWNKFNNFKNYAEPGFTTLDLLWKLQKNNDIIGDVAILMIGVNDILLDCSFQMVGENIEKILNLLKKRFKKIVLISILPTSDKIKNNNILIVNKNLKNIQGIFFLDAYDLFLGDSTKIDNKFTGDGIHLNDYAYKILNKKIEEALQ